MPEVYHLGEEQDLGLTEDAMPSVSQPSDALHRHKVILHRHHTVCLHCTVGQGESKGTENRDC